MSFLFPALGFGGVFSARRIASSRRRATSSYDEPPPSFVSPMWTPMLEYENRDDRWRRQTKEKFEELGRFVQAFELMVDATRKGLWFMIQAPGRSSDRTRIILNHHNLTAQPLFDMFRAVAAGIIADPAYGFSDEETKYGAGHLEEDGDAVPSPRHAT